MTSTALGPQAPVCGPDPHIVTVKNASFGYGGRPIISDVSFSVGSGEVVAVLGPNGSGKSTLMRGLLGLNDHIDGELELFGVPAARFKERTRVGYVPQRHTLSTSVRATVEEIVEVGRLPHRPWYRRAGADDSAAVRDALRQVGLADRARSDVSALSGGQQRRVLIARALAGQPDILIMDEPTAGVDTASQRVLADVLSALAERGVTMIIVTHEIEALSHIVTRVIEINHGGITFDGTPPRYARRFADSLMESPAHHVTEHLHAHAPGAHEAHHDAELNEERSPYPHGPLDAGTERKQRDARG